MLKGKTALVTGSTSGIGLGIALALARQGAHVVLNGFGEYEAARSQIAALGVTAGYHGADMTQPEEIAEMMAYANKEFDGIDILKARERDMRRIRGKRAGLILQDPKYALNPVMTAGDQVAEAWRTHKGGSARAASAAAIDLLDQVRLAAPEPELSRTAARAVAALRQGVVAVDAA